MTLKRTLLAGLAGVVAALLGMQYYLDAGADKRADRFRVGFLPVT